MSNNTTTDYMKTHSRFSNVFQSIEMASIPMTILAPSKTLTTSDAGSVTWKVALMGLPSGQFSNIEGRVALSMDAADANVTELKVEYVYQDQSTVVLLNRTDANGIAPGDWDLDFSNANLGNTGSILVTLTADGALTRHVSLFVIGTVSTSSLS